jgi:methanogenic corrinoid protein MtbC1
MSEVNEQSFSAGKAVAGRPSRRVRERLAAPIWRIRPAPAVVETLRTHIIPKIVLALRSLPVVVTPTAAERTERSPIEVFADLAVSYDDEAAFSYVERLLASGSSVESILLDLLAPTARHLGTLWETDAEDFVTVTLGVSRLQRIMRQLGESFLNEGHRGGGGESVLLTIIPGEQHSFGLSMVAEFFRRAGWNLCTGPFESHQELISLVQYHWFDVVGFSVSSDRRLDELKQDIGAIRRDSRNRHVGIMLGGPTVIMQPELVASMGADVLSVDAATAPQQAHELILQRTKAG